VAETEFAAAWPAVTRENEGTMGDTTEFVIKSIAGRELHRVQATSLIAAVEEAVRCGVNLGDANLGDANLGGAYLGGANLGGAYLRGANLGDANLGGANLGGAYLGDAYLGGAYLGGANLGGANLGDAYLGGANLRDANLGGAHLRGANLGGANLRGAYLGDAYLGGAYGSAWIKPIREDFFAVLDAAPAEVPGLLAALRDGRVDGSCYEGECACLLGTIANVRGCDYRKLGIEPDADRPAERFFVRITPGLTPDISSAAAMAVGWIYEWREARHAAAAAAAGV
jgi:hypothetical protein